MSYDNCNISDKCDSILKEIEQEEANHQKLKKALNTCKNNTRVVEILNNPSFAREKLFQVRVKVFRSLTELLKVYPEKVRHGEFLSPKFMDMNLYFIEVYVSRLFHGQLLCMNWIADFSVVNTNCKIHKSVNLKKHAANPLTVIVPFPRTRTNDEIVKVKLTSPSWRQVELAAIQTDISFKFISMEEGRNARTHSVEEDILKINGIYNSAFKDHVKEQLSYRLRCQLDRESFAYALVLNSYHNLYPSQIICNEGNRASKIEINDQQVQLELDVGKKSLRIEASGEELRQLKRYFTTANESLKSARKDFLYIESVSALKEARTKLMENLQYNRINVPDLLNVYDVYHRFVDGCPL